MTVWPACKIRHTDAGPVTVLAYAGSRKPKKGKSLFVAGYCQQTPEAGFRVEVEVLPEDQRSLAFTLLGLPPE